ncbi:hypothetical protein [Melghirimyces profundicolus]|uniref:hypothetical protein n=1 Tax=Melghirimyces profundicolus TaxID=1242148 RepID=UPI0011B24156|nr:hypothetical protein [Melghirimyces profundicolus]
MLISKMEETSTKEETLLEAFSGVFTLAGAIMALSGVFFALRGKSAGMEWMILGALSLLVGWLA